MLGELQRSSGVKQTDVVPSITDLYLEAFVVRERDPRPVRRGHQRHRHRLRRHVLPAGGEGPHDRRERPSSWRRARRPKKIAAAKAAKEAKAAAPTEAPTGPTEEEIQAKIAGLDPEKAAKVRAAMEAKAKKAAAAAPAPAGPTEDGDRGQDSAVMDPEKAAKVRAAMEAKARKAAEGKGE